MRHQKPTPPPAQKPSTAAEAVAWCRERCVGLRLGEDGKIHLDGDPEIRRRAAALLKPMRDEVALLLAAEALLVAPCGSLHCKGCYMVLPGAYLHPPRSTRGEGKTPDLVYKGKAIRSIS